MVYFVWEFVIRVDRAADFERLYESGGPWASLFARSPGFRGTSLLHNVENPRRFLTVDRWDSVDAQSAMRETLAREYEELDRACEQLTESERRIGIFHDPHNPA